MALCAVAARLWCVRRGEGRAWLLACAVPMIIMDDRLKTTCHAQGVRFTAALEEEARIGGALAGDDIRYTPPETFASANAQNTRRAGTGAWWGVGSVWYEALHGRPLLRGGAADALRAMIALQTRGDSADGWGWGGDDDAPVDGDREAAESTQQHAVRALLQRDPRRRVCSAMALYAACAEPTVPRALLRQAGGVGDAPPALQTLLRTAHVAAHYHSGPLDHGLEGRAPDQLVQDTLLAGGLPAHFAGDTVV